MEQNKPLTASEFIRVTDAMLDRILDMVEGSVGEECEIDREEGSLRIEAKDGRVILLNRQCDSKRDMAVFTGGWWTAFLSPRRSLARYARWRRIGFGSSRGIICRTRP